MLATFILYVPVITIILPFDILYMIAYKFIDIVLAGYGWVRCNCIIVWIKSSSIYRSVSFIHLSVTS